jgi:hypothetical protein
MRQHIPGLRSVEHNPESNLDCSWCEWKELRTGGLGRSRFRNCGSSRLSPSPQRHAPSLDGCTALAGRSGDSIGSFATSDATPTCSPATKWMKNLY